MPRHLRKFHLIKHGLLEFLTAQELADATGVSLATAHRWMRDDPPAHYRELLEFKILGLVPGMPGLYVRDGELHTPTGYRVNQVELEQFAWNMTNFGQMVRENSRLRDEVRRLRHWLEQRQPDSNAAAHRPHSEPPQRSAWIQPRQYVRGRGY